MRKDDRFLGLKLYRLALSSSFHAPPGGNMIRSSSQRDEHQKRKNTIAANIQVKIKQGMIDPMILFCRSSLFRITENLS